jgi:hypothetical protein
MFDIALANSVLDLFGKLLGYVDREAKNRREVFERTCLPLFEQLEILAKEYYAAIHKASLQLAKPNPDLRAIADELEAERGAIIIAREGILGRAAAFGYHYGHYFASGKADGAVDPLRGFAEAVTNYFYVEHGTGLTGITTLSAMIQFYLDFDSDVTENELMEVRDVSRRILQDLEARWKEIAKRFERVRLSSET